MKYANSYVGNGERFWYSDDYAPHHVQLKMAGKWSHHVRSANISSIRQWEAEIVVCTGLMTCFGE